MCQSHRPNTHTLYLNCTYAKRLDLAEHTRVRIRRIHRTVPHATAITLEPLSLDDWQILELNVNLVQANLLAQLRCVYLGQHFPIWIDRDLTVFVRTKALEPCLDQGIIKQSA